MCHSDAETTEADQRSSVIQIHLRSRGTFPLLYPYLYMSCLVFSRRLLRLGDVSKVLLDVFSVFKAFVNQK